MPINPDNKGRLINFVNGITGVSPGANAVVNMPVNQRYHRITFQCAAVNYTGGTSLAVVKITSSAGAGATITPTVVNGVITGGSVTAGGTGWTVGDTFTLTDATGIGFIGTVATVTGGPPGAIATFTVTLGGTASPIEASKMLTALKLLVNGVVIRDIVPDMIQRINIANGMFPSLGQLTCYFTAPWRNVNQQNEITSWDLYGQSTFQIQATISATVGQPSLTAEQEFDFLRNVRPDKANPGKTIPFLQPEAQHSFTWPIVSGRNDINTLPFAFPISRMWLLGSSPGNITQTEVFQDGNKPFEALLTAGLQMYEDYGFQFGQPNYINQTRPTNNTLLGAYTLPVYFDTAFISDPDQRWWKALKCQNSMILRVFSNIAQSLTIVQETLPGSFS